MIELGPLGLGTAPLAGLYEPVDDDTAYAVVDRAWDLGIRYFDTAPYYGSGLAEQRLGASLSGKPRRRVRRVDESRPAARASARRIGTARTSTSRTTARCARSSRASGASGLDRVDIALVHDPDDHYDEALAGAYRGTRRAA